MPANESTKTAMIDYIALGLGHGLLAIALVRMFLRSEVDYDPLIESMRDTMRRTRMEASTAGRNAKRRKEAKTATAKARRPSTRGKQRD